MFDTNILITVVISSLITYGSMKIPGLVKQMMESNLMVKYGGIVKNTYKLLDPLVAASLKGDGAKVTYQTIKDKVMQAASSGLLEEDIDAIANYVVEKFDLEKVL